MKTLLGIGGVILLLLAGLIGYNLTPAEPSEGALGNAVGTATGTLNGSGVASTTPSFLSSTATSTYATIRTEGASSVDLNLQFTASTTASQLIYLLEFSNDGIDWFQEDIASVSGSVITHNATNDTGAFTYHAWTPGATGISRKNVTITNVASKYMRVKATTWSANGSLWGQYILNKPF